MNRSFPPSMDSRAVLSVAVSLDSAWNFPPPFPSRSYWKKSFVRSNLQINRPCCNDPRLRAASDEPPTLCPSVCCKVRFSISISVRKCQIDRRRSTSRHGSASSSVEFGYFVQDLIQPSGESLAFTEALWLLSTTVVDQPSYPVSSPYRRRKYRMCSAIGLVDQSCPHQRPLWQSPLLSAKWTFTNPEGCMHFRSHIPK